MNLYQTVSSILDRVFHTTKGTYKTAIYDTLAKKGVHSSQYARIYKLVNGIMTRNESLDALLGHLKKKGVVSQLKNESLFKILVFEKFFGEKTKAKRRIGGAVARLVKELDSQITDFLKETGIAIGDVEAENQQEKKFFRVLTRSKKKFERIIETLSNEMGPSLQIKESNEPPIPRGIWLTNEQMKELKKAGYELHKSSYLVAQTASSCLPATILKSTFDFHLLLPSGDSPRVIDTCAAPGNKTLQLIEYFYPHKVIAFDKDPKRFSLLESRLSKFSKTKNWEAKNKNFLEIDHNDFSDVQAILLDPSCSGTGMLLTNNQFPFRASIKSQDNDVEYENDLRAFFASLGEEEKAKVLSLKELQCNLIRHAMGFPSVSTLVYSTCSILPQENEEVVEKVLESIEGRHFELVEIPQVFWKRRGLSHRVKGQGSKCIRADPIVDKTDGFFVALFKRKNIPQRESQKSLEVALESAYTLLEE